jgi:hypothetical protein
MDKEQKLTLLGKEAAAIKVRIAEEDKKTADLEACSVADMAAYLQLKQDRKSRIRRIWDIRLDR